MQVGFYKKNSGRFNFSWSEAVDAAICYGWIDGVRNAVDEISYTVRFTPRKARSIWSAVNIKKVEELVRCGLMRPAGIAAFERRDEKKSAIYAYEQKNAALGEDYEARFRGLGIFRGASRLLPANGNLVGDKRETGRNAPQKTRHLD